MTKIRLAYVQEFTDRHGTVRRAGCKRVLLPGAPGSPDFNAAYESALASLPKPSMLETQGSIAALVAAYYKSDAFTKALAPETQRMRRNILDRLRERHLRSFLLDGAGDRHEGDGQHPESCVRANHLARGLVK